MKKLFKDRKTAIKTVVNALLVFFLAVCISLASLAAIVRFTFFNSAFLSDSLNESNYYSDLRAEIKDKLVNIGDASGLDRDFFDDFIDEVMVREDVQNYVDSFYSGSELKVNTKRFEEKLRTALEEYEIKKGIQTDKIKTESIDYFVKEAAKVYSDGIKIPYFSSIQKGFLEQTTKFTIYMIIFGVCAAGIIVLLIFTEKWKHKAVRRIYYGVASAGLFMLIIPVAVFVSGLIGKIQFISKSVEDMYVTLLNTFFGDILTIAVIYIIIAIALCVVHLRMRVKAAE